MTTILPQQGAPPLPTTYADPVVKWAGGKRSLRRHLLALVPQRFKTFYEPFLGGATFFLALEPLTAVLGDANCELIEMYWAVRDEPDAVIRALDRMQGHALDEAYYYRVRSVPPDSLSLHERAARFIYLNKTCYNGLYRVNRAGHFNVPFGRYATPPSLYNRANFLRVSELLQRADLRCSDFGDILAEASRDDFVYLDPPYVPLTSTASFTRYTSGAFGAEEQERLAEAVHLLTARGCRVLLSNSDTPMVRRLYGSYTLDVVYAPRNINSDALGRQKIAELAVRNYDL